jgi:hypothetical protein
VDILETEKTMSAEKEAALAKFQQVIDYYNQLVSDGTLTLDRTRQLEQSLGIINTEFQRQAPVLGTPQSDIDEMLARTMYLVTEMERGAGIYTGPPINPADVHALPIDPVQAAPLATDPGFGISTQEYPDAAAASAFPWGLAAAAAVIGLLIFSAQGRKR